MREHFKYIHLGMLSEIKRKTLPAIARICGDIDAQALHHFVANGLWDVQKVRNRRLQLLRQVLAGRSFVLCIDETGDKKKGKTTDFVASQYIGNLGKVTNGIVSVKASLQIPCDILSDRNISDYQVKNAAFITSASASWPSADCQHY